MKVLTAKSIDDTELDVNGYVDEKNGIEYIGKATKMPDGTWQCLAIVGVSLCRVEITVTFGAT